MLRQQKHHQVGNTGHEKLRDPLPGGEGPLRPLVFLFKSGICFHLNRETCVKIENFFYLNRETCVKIENFENASFAEFFLFKI